MKNSFLDEFKIIFPDFEQIKEQHVLDDRANEIGWNSVVLTSGGETISAGTHWLRETARKIAIAEALERATVRKLIKENAQDFLMNEFPSSSGCAVGFDRYLTRSRALFEGIERWTWSQWIDYGYRINKVDVKVGDLTPLARHYYQKFEEVVFYEKIIDIEKQWIGFDKVKIGIFLGISGQGIYPGSRVALVNDDVWTHGAIESWRNYTIANLNLSGHKNSAILERILFFSKNKNIAFQCINNSQKKDWKSPDIRLLKELENNDGFFFFWRSLCNGFIPWHLGDEKRFVY